MKKILQVKIPIVKSYKWHAVPLTILSSHVQNEPWIYNNYLQLCVQGFPTNVHWLEFYSLYDLHYVPHFPWLNVENISIDTICRYTDIITFLIDCINNNRYVDLLYDLYYVEHGFTYMKSHRISNLLVYGYDLEDKVFYVMDYTYNTRNIYESIKIGMDSLARSTLETRSRGIKGIYEYKEDYHFVLNVDLAITLLSDYLGARNSIKFLDEIHKIKHINLAYGMNAYNYLKQFMDMVIGEETQFNILPLCTLLEQKICIYCLIEYIAKEYGICVGSYHKEIFDMAYAIKNLGLKYKIVGDKAVLGIIGNKLNELEIKEYQVVSFFLNILKQL